ncbi:DUF1652 domain-containing protein [Pseudomonas sp. P5_152]|nr:MULTISPECIES: DUF1652 domain-containing protein [unclassified Pseudomonas]MDX9668430.1 DUF1652 domain-containing protein [Pseudomonas sp. P5_152]
MMTQAQLRSYIEQALAPLACDFSVDADGCLTLRVFEAQDGRVHLVVTGIKPGRLTSASDLAQMLEELRYELSATRLGQADSA